MFGEIVSGKLDAAGSPRRRAPALSDVKVTSSGFAANRLAPSACRMGLWRIIVPGSAVRHPLTSTICRRQSSTRAGAQARWGAARERFSRKKWRKHCHRGTNVHQTRQDHHCCVEIHVLFNSQFTITSENGLVVVCAIVVNLWASLLSFVTQISTTKGLKYCSVKPIVSQKLCKV